MREAPRWISAVSIGALAVLVLGSAQAQAPERRLDKAEVSFPQEFGSVRGVRELPDGRVLVADGMGQALVVLDLATGKADTIGRPGQGPEEYRQPDGLFPLPGDSTLLVDLGNGRLTVLGPDLSFGETSPIAQGQLGPGAMSIRLPAAVDSQGRIYYQQMGRMRPGGGLADSASVMRWDRYTGTVDTVAQVKLPEVTTSQSGGRNERMVQMMPVPMSAQDGWAAGWDGWVAVARAGDYHVEWVRPDGRVIRGSANPYKPVRIGRAEKEAWVDGLQSSGLRVGVQNESGRISTTFRRGGGGSRPDIDAYQWPEVMPAFRPRGIHATPAGDMWVERYVPADAPPTFDVFDRDARLVRRVVLPEGRQVVGFGDGVVYLVRVDEFDLQWLERYRLES
ncbi:MAG: hypothetical protein GTN62_07630 [Gemmatimonadales bacterium]|nr:hypothetical protein [Gemmatimonadales bacterium]NIN11361.1 hypothetical protein [Gemmatimonadales bacterium]NIN49971.1 hypothetical protein [Gemmatimonadales bacterium]NIP07435.1 hypothetical protein [Gemmatimonadales bacterium]NIR00502.1 hypothetical protein [Gemmatimonadales bacterium]